MTAVDLSGDVALIAVSLLTANLLLGLLLSVGYNPARQWPRQRIKLFPFHNWTGYVALAATALHAAILLFSTAPRFTLFDVLVPIRSPEQPVSNTLGAIGLYLVAIVVATSLKRSRIALGRHRWKAIHYTTYAAAGVFFIHGLIADPKVQGSPVDYLDGEKVYIEACALAVLLAVAWRVEHRRAIRRRLQQPTGNSRSR
ncbi:MAG: ferric reductase-like transmembrane domain-containing protein [Vicinamibacterales bacterium]